MSVGDPRVLLGLPPTAPGLAAFLSRLSNLSSIDVPAPEIKAYSDALYMNYFTLGVSLMFVSKDDSRRISAGDAHGDSLRLDSIDIYNVSNGEKPKPAIPATTGRVYSTYPAPSLAFALYRGKKDEEGFEEIEFTVMPSSTGKDIVGCLGEPDRKGGGSGPSSGSIGIWCEWSGHGILVEFGGDESRGPKAWEQGKDARWKVLTLFQPKEN